MGEGRLYMMIGGIMFPVRVAATVGPRRRVEFDRNHVIAPKDVNLADMVYAAEAIEGIRERATGFLSASGGPDWPPADPID